MIEFRKIVVLLAILMPLFAQAQGLPDSVILFKNVNSIYLQGESGGEAYRLEVY